MSPKTPAPSLGLATPTSLNSDRVEVELPLKRKGKSNSSMRFADTSALVHRQPCAQARRAALQARDGEDDVDGQPDAHS